MLNLKKNKYPVIKKLYNFFEITVSFFPLVYITFLY